MIEVAMSRLVRAAALLTLSASIPLAAQQQTASAVSTVRSTVSRAMLLKAREHALTTIQGNALNATNGHLDGALVRLRDARFGRIVGTQLTDKSGLFTFKALDPGTYIVEIIASDLSVLAASQLLSVNAGEAVSAVVKLPLRIPPFAGILGGTTTPAATAVATEAAMSSVVALVPTIPISPNQ
jgi:hypothetical protein